MKYRTTSHLTGKHGQSVPSGSVVDGADLGDKETIERYTDLGAIAKATDDEIASADIAVGGSIVSSSPAENEAVADEAATKAAAPAKDAKK